MSLRVTIDGRVCRMRSNLGTLPWVVAAVLVAVVGSAGAFDGRIVDEEGRAVAGARVTLVGRPGMVVADGDGRFSLSPDPQPPFVLVVARADGVAFAPLTVAEVPPGQVLILAVKPLGGTITVLSGAPPDLEVPPAAAATVLGRAEIEERISPDLAAALGEVAGVSISGVGPAEIPALRGLPKGRSLILLDEGRVTAERRAGPSATFLDPETVDEIEVIRGPGSVAYGSDAFGGVIRARSHMPIPGRAPEVAWSLLGATATRETGATAEVSRSGLGGAVLLGLHARRQGDTITPEGTTPASGARRAGFRLAWQRPLGVGMLRVGWRTDVGRDIGKPGPDSASTRREYPEEDSHRLSIGYEQPGPGAWDRLSASFMWDSYRLVLNKDALVEGDVVSRSQSEVDSRDWELRVEGERSWGRSRLIVGVNGYGRYGLRAVNRSFGSAAGDRLVLAERETAVDGARSLDLGLFAGLSRPVGTLRLSTGLRADSVSSRSGEGSFPDRSISHTALSGFVAAGLPLGKGLEVTLQGARGFRDARLSDRFYRGETGRGYITGNPDLEPETSRQVDLALRWQRDGFELALYGYVYRIRNLIERYRDGDDYFFRNRGEAQLHGFELEGTIPLDSNLSLRLGIAGEHGEIRGSGDPVDDVPAARLLLGLRGRLGERCWWFLRTRTWDRKTRPGPSEREVPGAAVIDTGAGFNLGRGLQLRVILRNVLDRSYLPSADEDAVLAPGRSLAVHLGGRY